MRVRGLIAGAIFFGALLTGASEVRACQLTKVTTKNAKLRVYFTRFPKEDNTRGKYKKCRIVPKGGETFRVTPFRQDANVVVHRKNWPR